MIPRPGAQGQPFGVYEWGESEIELFPDSAAREFADELRTQALESLAIFGERGRRLIELTDFITHRDF